MNKTKYLYDIFDIKTNEFIAVNIRNSEITEIIDMPHEKVSEYSKNGKTYRGYRVTRKNIDGVRTEDITEKKSHITDSMWEEFEEITKHIRSIATDEQLRRIKIRSVPA